MRCHACDGRTDTRTVESSAVFSLSWIRKNNSCRNWLALPSPVFCEMVIFKGIIKLSRLREWSCSIHYMGSNMSSPARLALTEWMLRVWEIHFHAWVRNRLGVDCSICGFPGYATYVNILYCLHHRLTYLKWDNNRIEDGTSSDFALICFAQEANIFSESLGWSNNLASVTHKSLRWFHRCSPFWTLVHFDSPNSIHMSWFLLIWIDRA